MKSCPVDTFKNSLPEAKFLCREVFAYPPRVMDSNHIRDFRWWNTMAPFRRAYREWHLDFRFGKNALQK